MAVEAPRTYADVNAVVGGYLRDLAFAQSSQQKMFGYKRAAAAILSLDVPLTDLRRSRRRPAANPRHRSGVDARHPRDSGDRRVADRRTGHRAERAARRYSSGGVNFGGTFLSRAEVRRILADPAFAGPTVRAVPRRSANALRME